MPNYYPPQNNGPHTTLSVAIGAGDTSITVDDASILPNAPNVATIGLGEDAELILLQAKTGNILTAQRGYNGTTARGWQTGDWIYRAITAQDISELQTEKLDKADIANNLTTTTPGVAALDAAQGAVLKSMIDQVWDTIFEKEHPVGDLYFTTKSGNPATWLGKGAWAAWGAGRVPVGVDAEQTEFNAVEKTGGAKTHKLIVSELPSHAHPLPMFTSGGGALAGGIVTYGTAGYAEANRYQTQGAGGDTAHNNLQPYVTCYIWKRTA